MSAASYSLDKLYERDSGTCWLCHKNCPRDQATRDHVIPKSHGGPNASPNLRIAHADCNVARGNSNRIPDERETFRILAACQENSCENCKEELMIKDAKLTKSKTVSKRLILVHASGCERKHIVPFQRNSRKSKKNEVPRKGPTGRDLRRIRSQKKYKRKVLPMEMSVIDILEPFQVEENDYVRFFHDDVLHFGKVISIEDNGDSFSIRLFDDVEGDDVTYEIPLDIRIGLLSHEVVAI